MPISVSSHFQGLSTVATATTTPSSAPSTQSTTTNPIYIFAYGSLINAASVRRSVSSPISSTPTPVSITGFKRSWSFKCSRRQYTAVSISPSKSKTDSVNGVLLKLSSEADLKNLDAREQGYMRTQICMSRISQPYKSATIEPHAQVWAYVLEDCDTESGYESDSSVSSTKSHVACPKVPIPQSYVDCILAGALLEHGQQFAIDFIRSTDMWHEGTWINDRNAQDPVRRYVPNAAVGEKDLCPNVAQAIDDLLRALVPDAFSSRIDVA
ncbi:hypothetical protein HDU79_002899 [Rhizoclosmatium sp. JEL0117]|nr:hypothetical protein HDU79_002899 [Rhizoclosmatium sp. JEL0117]